MSSAETTKTAKRRSGLVPASLLLVALYVFSHAPIYWLVFEYGSMYRAAVLSHTVYWPVKVLQEHSPCGVVLKPWSNFCGRVVYSVRNPGRPDSLW